MDITEDLRNFYIGILTGEETNFTPEDEAQAIELEDQLMATKGE